MLRSLLFGGSSGPDYIFPTVNPEQDGPDCRQDCTSCTAKFPAKFKIDTTRPLYGHIKEFSTHVLVATGKADWIPKVKHDKGSLMEAFAQTPVKSRHGKIMVSASNLQPLETDSADSDAKTETEIETENKTTVLLLPSFTFVDFVGFDDVPELIHRYVDFSRGPGDPGNSNQMTARACQHEYVVLLCSHQRRDARCGLTAPIIKRELERHLRPLGLFRDANDERPGGVGIYFVSHVGGHKFAANVLVYRKTAQQMIWLARVRPEHCEGIVRYTLLEGKVVYPETQLRGGFDRTKGLTSW